MYSMKTILDNIFSNIAYCTSGKLSTSGKMLVLKEFRMKHWIFGLGILNLWKLNVFI